MGLLDGKTGGGMLGLLSPDDRLMAALSALSQAGAAMAQPGQSRGQALASGFGAMGPGMMQGMQSALMQNIMLGKVQNEAAQRKAQQDAILSLPEDQRGIASANPAEFFKTKIDRMMPKQAEVPFGAMGADGAPSLAGYLDYLQKKAGAEAGGRETAQRVAQNAVPLTTESPEFKARVAGATETAQQAAQMPFVGPRAAAAAAASSPYDIAKAWAIPRSEAPGSRIVAGGGSPDQPMRVISTSPNPAPGSQQGKYEQGIGELQSKTVEGWRTGAEAGFATLQNVDRMKQAVDNGLQTGTFAPIRQAAVTALADLGVSQESLNKFFSAKNAKDFDAAAKEMVLPVIKTLGANPTNTDRDFIEKTIPQLRDNPEAVKSLLDWMGQKAQGKIDLYSQGYEHSSKGGDPLKFEQDWWKKRATSKGGPDIEALLKKYAP